MIPEQMKASSSRNTAAPEVLHYTDFPVPQPQRGEALVKVHAVGLNGYDLMARAGRYKPNKGKFPHILGGDFGGELVALGPETHLRSSARHARHQLVDPAVRPLRAMHGRPSQPLRPRLSLSRCA